MDNTQSDAYQSAKTLLRTMSKKDLAAELGVSRVTLDWRLKQVRPWKTLEIKQLQEMCAEISEKSA